MPHKRKYSAKDGSGRTVLYTPVEIARSCVEAMNIDAADSVCDCCAGIDQQPFLEVLQDADWFEIEHGRDFMLCDRTYDWIVGNIPFNQPQAFLDKMAACAVKGFGILCLANSLTQQRLLKLQRNGFYLTKELVMDTNIWGFGYKTCFHVFTREPSAAFGILMRPP